MVLLDTNILIEIVRAIPQTTRQVEEWLEEGEAIGTSSVAWGEFLSSPKCSSRMELISAIVGDQILSFGPAEAELAGMLARETVSGRGHRWDTFIAATTILAQARLATRNERDFLRFIPFGLKLA